MYLQITVLRAIANIIERLRLRLHHVPEALVEVGRRHGDAVQPCAAHVMRWIDDGDPRVRALLAALLVFRLLPRGFTNRDLRQHLTPLLGDGAAPCTPGRMTYDLRRLRLHRLIVRLPHSRRYEVTDQGFRTALFLTRAYTRLLRPGVAIAIDQAPPTPTQLQRAIAHVDRAITRMWTQQQVAA